MITKIVTQQVDSCPNFPHFGASHPDATCIDGYLWDLDSYDEGVLYSGGQDPCPFCNTEAYLKRQGIDISNRLTKEQAINYIVKLKEKYKKLSTV